MARAIWTGTLSFGLVSIPVRLFNATAPKDVRFHQFEQGTGRRIRLRRVAPEAELEPGAAWEPGSDQDEPSPAASPADEGTGLEQPVTYDRVVKGFEVDRDRYVMVSPEELEALAPEQTRTIEIEDFVDLAGIDPVYFEKSYYVAPQRGAEKPYGLLLDAMQEAGKVAIGRFVLRSREHLVAIRPREGVIGLETLFYADEIRPPREAGLPVESHPVAERERTMAGRLIELLGTTWDPERYRDTYRERVLDLIEAKTRGEEFVVQETEDRPAVPDLMAALRASVDEAKRRRADGDDARRTAGG